jgi:hypothetical protein
MKKFSLILVLLLILNLHGCSLVPTGATAYNVETLQGWSFQYNEGTNEYSVFFALLTKTDRYVSADVDVDIRIVNDDGAEVYNATHSISKDDFGYYTSQVAGEQYLANVRIPASKISAGTNASGKVYLTVYKGDFLRFDEVNCVAYYCLPIMDAQLVAEGLPAEININGYDGKVESIIKIEEVTYIHDKEYASQLNITFAGEKTYGGTSSSYDVIAYKIYDSKGYMIDSGFVYLRNLVSGDKFKDDAIVVYDVTPGEVYTIQFSEYNR